MTTYWEHEFEKVGAFWVHDGNPNRPYVRLASGLISNGYFNCGLIMSEHPALFRHACEDLTKLVRMDMGHVTRIVGAAKGGIILANQLASLLGTACAYAEKTQSGSLLFDERFSNFFAKDEVFMLCEDTISTGSTLIRLMQAVNDACPTASFGCLVLAICNRSGKKLMETIPIVSLIERELPVWKDGENPFTEDGKELVEPLSAGKQNWKELTRAYA